MEMTWLNLLLILLVACVLTFMATWLLVNEAKAGEYVTLAKRYKNLSEELGLENPSWATRMSEEFCRIYELMKMEVLFSREEYSRICRSILEKRTEGWPWDAGYIGDQRVRDDVAKEVWND